MSGEIAPHNKYDEASIIRAAIGGATNDPRQFRADRSDRGHEHRSR